MQDEQVCTEGDLRLRPRIRDEEALRLDSRHPMLSDLGRDGTCLGILIALLAHEPSSPGKL